MKVTAKARSAAADAGPTHRPRPAHSLPSFDAVVRQHSGRIGALCYRLLGWRADVDDVVQDVFLAAYQALPEFRGQSRVSTWLTTIAINACRNHLRKRKRWVQWFRSQARGAEPILIPVAGKALTDCETHAQVREFVRQLPEMYREVVVLRYLEEMGIAEIATVLDLAKNTVEVRLSRARVMLRETLGPLMERDRT